MEICLFSVGFLVPKTVFLPSPHPLAGSVLPAAPNLSDASSSPHLVVVFCFASLQIALRFIHKM